MEIRTRTESGFKTKVEAAQDLFDRAVESMESERCRDAILGAVYASGIVLAWLAMTLIIYRTFILQRGEHVSNTLRMLCAFSGGYMFNNMLWDLQRLHSRKDI